MERLISLLGLFVLMFLAWLLSSDRKKMNYRLIISGVLLQTALALIILKTDFGLTLFQGARNVITTMLEFSDAGAELVFGGQFKEHFFAFSVLPTIIFVSAVMAVLFHLGIMQWIVKAMAWVMVKVMDVSGSESLAASANVFVGQTEAPLVIKPYIESMTKSEIMSLMTGGMATIAGGVMAAYASFGADPGHLLTASIMSAPAAIVIAKIMFPEREKSVSKGVVKIDIPKSDSNILDAACRGAGEGLKLALNVGAMLIAFVAFTALVNHLLGFVPTDEPLTFERILGWFFRPIAWILGVSWADSGHVAPLLGKKMFLNEFVAYLDLMKLKETISPRAFIISTYALCGFANFGSIAIQIGGIGGLVPGRRKDLAAMGFKAMLGGTIAALMTATIAGVLI